MLAFLLVAQSLVAQVEEAPSAEELQAQVTRLVRQLDDRELARRESAEEALIELGPAALEYLPLPDAEARGEAAERLARVRLALEQAEAQEFTEASHVTLQGAYTLSEALAAIQEQTGNQIVDYRSRFGGQADEKSLELDLADVTFWTAIDTVLDEAEITIYPYADEPQTLAVFNRPPGQRDRVGHGIEAGLFRVEAQRLEATRDLQNPENSTLTLWLQLAWEPRVEPIVIMQPLEEVEAEDENGRLIEVAETAGTREIVVQGNVTALELSIGLESPSRDVEEIASLVGSFSALVPGNIESFEFANLPEARNVEVRKAGAVVTLMQARENGSVYDVRMSVRFDEAGSALQSHLGWVYANEAYLLDANGEKAQNAGFEAIRQTRNEIGMSYKFFLDAPADQYTFVYRTPVALIEVPIEFELESIPLP